MNINASSHTFVQPAHSGLFTQILCTIEKAALAIYF